LQENDRLQGFVGRSMSTWFPDMRTNPVFMKIRAELVVHLKFNHIVPVHAGWISNRSLSSSTFVMLPQGMLILLNQTVTA
jgi:hypothetical protein